MNKRRKIIILTISLLVIGISTVYAATLINASDVIYNNSKSKGSSDNVQGAIDELYDLKGGSSSGSSTNKRGINLISYITNLAKTDTTNLAYDDTSDKNLRFIGSNPNNYVLFNDELWRIIGVMNNVTDADGNSASRVKLIRAESIGKYSYDNKPSGTGSSISTVGSNSWSDSRLMSVLNSGPYWNRTSGACPYENVQGVAVANRTTSCDFSNNGLTSESKSMISNVVWNLGGRSDHNANASTFYTSERGTATINSRPSKWTGYIGLMYPSDYGYAVGGDSRSVCLSSYVVSYNANNCFSNDWLFRKTDDNVWTWTMMPDTKLNHSVFGLNNLGSLGYYYPAFWAYHVYPTLYLNTNLYKIGGSGTITDPYEISFTSISKDESNASPPKLDDEGKLIPVILADDGKVTMVNEEDLAWYNYSEKQWANAIILVDSPSKTYKEGDTISESDIESYFVWIPKYKYRLWNTGTASKKAHEIDIVFDTSDTKDVEGESCKTPMTSGATGNCDNGEYMTHPAFISLGVDGFWVGKFETGYKGATSTTNAQVSSSDSSKIIIKPNVYSWRSNTLYNIFVSIYNYERNLDSHLMKNTEWGAVAILSHSKYGINNEVNINNNSSFKTGYSSLPTIVQYKRPGTYGDGANYNQPYNTSTGYLASTTGNITGVYDMSGGGHEYLAAYISGNLGSSGFTTSTIANYGDKYFDVYNASSTNTSYQYRILGDATGEMGPFAYYKDGNGTGSESYHNGWYADVSYFIESTSPWFERGGINNYGTAAGAFHFGRGSGAVSENASSRIVLSP